MKKFIALVLCLAVMCTAVSAMAMESTNYHIYTTNTQEFQPGHSGLVETTGDWWYITINDPTSVSATHRMVVRIHSGFDAASATWVYSTDSRTMHQYSEYYRWGGWLVQMRGRLDNRDSGLLDVSGRFVF